MVTEPVDLQAVTMWVEILCIVLIWVMMRYTVLFRPLKFVEKTGAFFAGIPSGAGFVRLYTHPSLAFFKTESLIGLVMTAIFALAVAWMCVLIANTMYWLLTRRSFLSEV